MEDPRERVAHDPSIGAFAAGLECWATLTRALTNTPPGSPDFSEALLSLRMDLAAQMDAWLKSSHPFTGSQFSSLVPPVGFTGPAGSARTRGPDTARMTALLNRWTHLQSQLAGHWSTIGQAAAAKFALQMGKPTEGAPSTDLRRVYDLWIDCAEEAYAETAHSDAFARFVADLTNTALALQLEGRQHLGHWARAAGLPTREEVDALRQRIDQLEQARRRTSRPKTSNSKRRKPNTSNSTRSKGKRQP